MRLSRSFALPLRPPARSEMRLGPPFAFGRNGLHSRSPGAFFCWTGVGCLAKTVHLHARFHADERRGLQSSLAG
jgi:hypothetical protein